MSGFEKGSPTSKIQGERPGYTSSTGRAEKLVLHCGERCDGFPPKDTNVEVCGWSTEKSLVRSSFECCENATLNSRVDPSDHVAASRPAVPVNPSVCHRTEIWTKTLNLEFPNPSRIRQLSPSSAAKCPRTSGPSGFLGLQTGCSRHCEVTRFSKEFA